MLTTLDPVLHTPERLPFIKKQLTFLVDHGFDTVATLVFQCAPVEPVGIDPMAGQLGNVLLQGSSQRQDGSWWEGFGGGNRKPTFDGHVSVEGSAEKRWAVEIQDDGHILAALRTVAYEDTPGVHPAILAAFADFALLVGRLRSEAGITGASKLTATLVNAKGQTLLGFAGYGRTQSFAVNRETLEWPVVTAANEGEIAQACEQLRLRFKRIFP